MANQEPPQQQSAVKRISVIVTRRAGKYLLLHRTETDKKYPDQWCCPGGHVEAHETMIEGAIRELREETQLECLPKFLKLIKVYNDPNELVHIYCTIKTRGNVALKDGEHDEFVWLEPSALRYYDTVPYCVETILLAEREQ